MDYLIGIAVYLGVFGLTWWAVCIFVPPPPPKQTIEEIPMSFFDEEHNLLGGKQLKLGDLVWLGRKCVITKIDFGDRNFEFSANDPSGRFTAC